MYRNLRAIMAKYDITVKKLAEIVGISQTSMSEKLNEHVGFTLAEVKNIIEFFNRNGENVTVEELFFAQVSTITD
jgi:DNA-binding XRE family transcriptional regulator